MFSFVEDDGRRATYTQYMQPVQVLDGFEVGIPERQASLGAEAATSPNFGMTQSQSPKEGCELSCEARN